MNIKSFLRYFDFDYEIKNTGMIAIINRSLAKVNTDFLVNNRYDPRTPHDIIEKNKELFSVLLMKEYELLFEKTYNIQPPSTDFSFLKEIIIKDPYINTTERDELVAITDVFLQNIHIITTSVFSYRVQTYPK